jgi:hypothetical protein
MKKNKVSPLPLYHTQAIKKEDLYYEQMMWCIYVLICCICLCTVLIMILLLFIEKDIKYDNNDNSLSG